MTTHAKTRAAYLWDAHIVRRASIDALRKLHPRVMARNPVMFVVEIGSVLTTLRLLGDAPAVVFDLVRRHGKIGRASCRERVSSPV